jgi:uncharacterized membrane protein
MEEALFIGILGLTVIVGAVTIPILAIVTFVRLRRLEQTVAQLQRQLGETPAAVTSPVQVSVTAPAPDTAAAVAVVTTAVIVEAPAAPAAVPAAATEPPAPTPAPTAPPLTPAAATLPPSAAPPAAPPRSRLDALPTMATAKTGFDWEHLIAGRWLNRVGLAAVAIGVAYFLKYAIDNDWIGPRGQVALGLLLGVALLAVAPRFVNKGLVYFAEGLTGLGAVILYLSLWAAGSYYGFLSPAMTFVAMAFVTAAMLTIALGRNSQRIAALAMAGGFLTPALVSTGRDAQVALFSYLALHNAALLVIAWTRRWRFLELPAFALTQLYFWGWFGRFYTDDRLLSTIAFAVLFFVQFSALSAIRSRRMGVLFPEETALSVLNAFALLMLLREVLWPEHRWMLAVSTLALAVAYLATARAVASRADDVPQARLLFAGLSLTCVTLAIPMSLDGSAITLAWAVEAAVLIWSGFTADLWYLRASGFVLFAMVAVRLAAFPVHATTFLFNARFGLVLATAACAGVAMACAHRWRDRLLPREALLFGALGVAVNILLLVGLTMEVELYYYTTRFESQTFVENRLAESLSVSLLWTAYATALVFVGMRLSSAALRWQALALFAITSLKVFFADLAYLRGFYRIVSSIALGVVLLAISYFYQRRLSGRRDDGASEDA